MKTRLLFLLICSTMILNAQEPKDVEQFARMHQQYIQDQVFLMEQLILNEKTRIQWQNGFQTEELLSLEQKNELEKIRQEQQRILDEKIYTFQMNHPVGSQLSGKMTETQESGPDKVNGLVLSQGSFEDHHAINRLARTPYSMKSAQQAAMKLDGVTGKYWDNSLPGSWSDVLLSRMETTFDENGKISSSVSYRRDTPLSPWENSSKRGYYYSDQLELDSIIYSYWDSYESTWQLNNKEGYVYDENGNMVLQTSYYWDSYDEYWRGNNKVENEYDANGNMILAVYSYWEWSLDDFRPDSKYEYAYTEDGEQTLYVRYVWDQSLEEWVGSNKNEYAFDENGMQTLYARYSWDYDLADWICTTRTESSFDLNENQTFYANYYWNFDLMALEGNWKYESSYDENGNRLENTEYTWDRDLADWVLRNKYSSLYIEDTVLTREFQLSWNGAEWDSTRRTDYFYGETGLRDSMLYYNSYWVEDSWFAYSKMEYTYDENKNLTEQISFVRNFDDQEWVPSNKGEYSYDSDGNNTLYASYRWYPEFSGWAGEYKYELVYNNQGEMIESINFIWNPVAAEWTQSGKSEYGYDINGQQVAEANYLWESGEWVGQGTKWSYEYDEYGNMILRSSYDWDMEHMDWRGYYYYRYSYDENTNLLSREYYDWNEEIWDWTGTSKTTYAYNEDGVLTGESQTSWIEGDWQDWRQEFSYDVMGYPVGRMISNLNRESQEWEDEYKEEFVYDTEFLPIEDIRYEWDETATDWVEDLKTVYQHDENGLMTSLISAEWSGTEGDWLNSMKTEYTYNTEGQSLTETSYRWNSIADAWEEYKMEAYEYDTEGILETVLGAEWDIAGSTWIDQWKEEYVIANHMITGMRSFNWESDMNAWRNNEMLEYFYTSTGILSEIVTYMFITEEESWSPDHKMVFVYIPSVSFETLLIPYQMEEYFSDGVLTTLSSFDWDDNQGRWEEDEIIEFQFSSLTIAEETSVTTQDVTEITSTIATGNGNITDLGAPNPSAYGVCWNTSGSPTISDGVADNGAASSTGAFTASMTSLSPNTTYYVRAYATNTAGTSYGSEVSFTTSAIIIPTIAFNATASSGLESVSSAVLQVDLSVASASDVTVDFTITGTATGSGTDYTLADGTLTIAAGSTTGNITIAGIVNDAEVESDETLIVTLSNPVNATLGTNTVHTYTISDNDDANGISEFWGSTIIIYPNPCINTIHFDDENDEVSHITLIDLSGRILLVKDNIDRKEINVSHLKSGVYFLKLENNIGEKQVSKFVKQ